MKKLDISFVKMHSTGNDFVIVNNILENYFLKKDQIIKLADRHYGVGCDQVLILSESINTGADFRFNIFNPDGQEVEQCVNGARCIADICSLGLAVLEGRPFAFSREIF